MNTFALEMKAVVDVDNDEEEMVVSGWNDPVLMNIDNGAGPRDTKTY